MADPKRTMVTAVFLDLESLVMKLRRAPRGYVPSRPRPRGGN